MGLSLSSGMTLALSNKGAPSIAVAVLSFLSVTGPQSGGDLPVSYTIDKNTGVAWGIGTGSTPTAAALRAGTGMTDFGTATLTTDGSPINITLADEIDESGLNLWMVTEGSDAVVTATGSVPFAIDTTTGFTVAGVDNTGSEYMSLQSGLGPTATVDKILIHFSFSPQAKIFGTLLDLGSEGGIFQTGSGTHRIGFFLEESDGTVIIPAGGARSDEVQIDDTVNMLVAVEAGGASQVFYKINNGAWVGKWDTTNTASDINIANQARFGILAEDIGNGNGVGDVKMYRKGIWTEVTTLPDISTSAVQDLFCDSDGVLQDPAATHTAYGDAASGKLRFDFYGNATAANAGTHVGAAGNGTVDSSGGFTNA